MTTTATATATQPNNTPPAGAAGTAGTPPGASEVKGETSGRKKRDAGTLVVCHLGEDGGFKALDPQPPAEKATDKAKVLAWMRKAGLPDGQYGIIRVLGLVTLKTEKVDKVTLA